MCRYSKEVVLQSAISQRAATYIIPFTTTEIETIDQINRNHRKVSRKSLRSSLKQVKSQIKLSHFCYNY